MSCLHAGSTPSSPPTPLAKIGSLSVLLDNSGLPAADDPSAVAVPAAHPPVAGANMPVVLPALRPATTRAATRRSPHTESATLRASTHRHSHTSHTTRSLPESALPSTSHH